MNFLKKKIREVLVVLLVVIFSGSAVYAAFETTQQNGAEILRFSDSHLEEHEILEAMNYMTHQKIKADDKWGYVLMDERNIETVKNGISNSDSDNKEILNSIIEKWENDDFSKVDQDHNIILDLQNGTIGKAYDILTPEQEQEIIDKKF